jgi:iron complex outermembrane receptor protein
MEGTMRAVALPSALLLTLVLLAVPAAAQTTLPGRVVDATTGVGVPARVEVIDTRAAITSDADGRFTLDPAGAERLTIVVSHPGYYVQRATVDVRTSASVEVRLVSIVTVADRIEVTASRAREGADAASFTNVPQAKVAETYFGQDPAILLAQVVPGVYATNDSGNGIGYSYFSIRGFGQARTRVMLNAAPLNDAESGELFFIDLADFMSTAGDVQVQRGVTGLSGLGGALDVTTALPPVERAFTVHVGAGSYGTRRLTFTWDSGLVDNAWAFSARYSKITTDGYRDQSWVDMWNYYFAAARFGERSRVRVVLFGGPERTHLAYEGVDQSALEGEVTGDADRDRRANPIAYPGEIDNFFQPHYQLVHDVTFSERTRFSQTIYGFLGDGYYDQFRARRWLFEYNLPPVTLPGGGTILRSDLVRRRNVDEWDAGWVPKLSHSAGRFGLDLNGEVRLHRAHHTGEVTWAQYYPVGVPPNHRYYDYRVAKNTATGVAAGRFQASSRLTLTAGLQLTRHEYELYEDQLKQVAFTSPYTFVLPRAGAVVSLGPSAEAYVSVARGQREPFFRNLYDPQDYYATPVTLAPEEVWNVEAGTSWRRDRWRLRANGYWMNFLNEIVYAGALDDNGVPIYGNGAKSRRLGMEVDGSAAIATHFAVDGALSLAHNTFTSYREYDYEGGAAVYDGNRVAGFPDVMASVTARAGFGASRATLSLRHVGRFFLDNTQDGARVNPAYTVVDAGVLVALPGRVRRAGGLARADLDIRLNNLFDRRYTTFGYVDGGTPLFIPAAGANLYVGLTVGF